MITQKRSRLALGFLLVVLGGWFLLLQIFPEWNEWFYENFSWPLIIIAIGIIALIFGLLIQVPEMAVPALILFGLGSLFY